MDGLARVSKDAQDVQASTIRLILRRRPLADVVFDAVGLIVVLVLLLGLAALIVRLAIDGAPRLDADFVRHFPSRHAEQAGVLSAWAGSLLVMLVTALAALPVGIAAAVWLEEYARRTWLTELIEINVANLAGVPSILYGLLALGLFVQRLQFGDSVLSAGLALAMMILPIVVVTTREALRGVPLDVREAAYGLGATRWQVTRDHVLPYATAGIATGAILGLSRAAGETAAVIAIGALSFIAFLPPSPLDPALNADWLYSPFTTLPMQAFDWLSRPDAAFRANAAAACLLLALLTLLLNGYAIVLRRRARLRLQW